MPHPVDIQLGARIRRLRTEKGLSLAELAQGIGVTYQQVQKYEKGTNRITARTLFMVCRFLGVSPGRFFDDLLETYDENQSPPLPLQSARAVRLLEEIPESPLKERLYGLIKALAQAERMQSAAGKIHEGAD